MYIILVVLGILVLGFVAVQIYFINSQSNIENYAYKTLRKFEKFENKTLRTYIIYIGYAQY